MLEFAPRSTRCRAEILAVPLPSPARPRRKLHTRSVRFEAYQRDDALWDLEAELVDIKPIDTPLESGVRPAGEPIHLMALRLTIDAEFNVLEAHAAFDRMPYMGFCDQITPEYGKLVGLNLLRGFRQRTAELFSRAQGCTHLTELLAHLPSAAVQSLFRKPLEDGTKPFQLDRCHALKTDGEAVRRYYPRWHRSADNKKASP